MTQDKPKPVITIGHVDHGKTTLAAALMLALWGATPANADTSARRPSPRDDQKAAALETAKARISEINAREAERLRLAALKRSRQSKQQRRGMA